MTTKGVRQFIYHYNQVREEIEKDLTGDRETPTIGSILSRNGKEWKVVHVIAPITLNGAVLVIRIFLTDRHKAVAFGEKLRRS